MKALVLLLVILIPATCCSQGMQQRLIGQCSYYDSSQKFDSLVLKCSGRQHSAFDYNRLDYLRWTKNILGGHDQEVGLNSIVVPNNIDSSDFCIQGEYDSLLYYVYNSNWDSMILMGYATQSRSSTGLLIAFTNANVLFPTHDYRNDYNFYYTNGQLDGALRTCADVGRSYYERYLKKDASGNVLVDSTVYYTTGSRMAADVQLFQFDTFNRYTTRSLILANPPFSPAFTSNYTYYPDGRVRTIFGNDSLRGTDSFSYSPGVLGYTGRIMSGVDTQTGAREIFLKYESHINAASQKDTVTEYIYDDYWGSTDTTMTVVNYNAYGNPSSIIHFRNDQGQRYVNDSVQYYYEFYHPALITAAPAASPITLSPNPTTGSITLHYPEAKPGAPLSIAIYNTTGQFVLSTTRIAAGADTQISLPDAAAPGLYYIRVLGEENTMLYGGAFLKR